jgi:hypothetical protein
MIVCMTNPNEYLELLLQIVVTEISDNSGYKIYIKTSILCIY